VIVIGVDPHKKTHAAAAVGRAAGEVVGELTVTARERGHEELLLWARELGGERLFALEDCRQVSGALERFLIGHGERVVRVPAKLMAGARKAARGFGKSDPIDALAVARAALREPDLPEARLCGPSLEIKLLLSHREDLVAESTRVHNRLRWHLHDLDPDFEIPTLSRAVWIERLQRRLRRHDGLRARLCRELARRAKQLLGEQRALERELAALLQRHAPRLLELPGCGTLTAAKLVAEVAGAERFRSEAQLAMLAGVAPLDASSGRQRRHRLNRRGNRQLNLALHRIAVNQARLYEPARAYLDRRRAEGKTWREALRCLKRHLVRIVFRILQAVAAFPELEHLPLEKGKAKPTISPPRRRVMVGA
jgi:transposase